MALLRPAPRGPPFDDFEQLFKEMSEQYNVLDKEIPAHAKEQWTEGELGMWFQSGGMLEPPDDPKMRKMAQQQPRTQR